MTSAQVKRRQHVTLAVSVEGGGHEIRTRNRLPGTTFPVWPLAIRLPSGDEDSMIMGHGKSGKGSGCPIGRRKLTQRSGNWRNAAEYPQSWTFLARYVVINLGLRCGLFAPGFDALGG
jgi:hypothetical protein